jgi:hypothetical protein
LQAELYARRHKNGLLPQRSTKSTDNSLCLLCFFVLKNG